MRLLCGKIPTTGIFSILPVITKSLRSLSKALNLVTFRWWPKGNSKINRLCPATNSGSDAPCLKNCEYVWCVQRPPTSPLYIPTRQVSLLKIYALIWLRIRYGTGGLPVSAAAGPCVSDSHTEPSQERFSRVRHVSGPLPGDRILYLFCPLPLPAPTHKSSLVTSR